MEGTDGGSDGQKREAYFRAAVEQFGRVLDRLAAGYEADSEKRHDLRQEIYLHLWRSFEIFDEQCSLKTWTLRVAHNTAVTYVARERRWNDRYRSLEELEIAEGEESVTGAGVIDRRRALDHLQELIQTLKPIDRQIMLSWLEDLELASIAEITGLTAANVAMKLHRIRKILAQRFHDDQEQQTWLSRQSQSHQI